jgi:hypothetical protein
MPKKALFGPQPLESSVLSLRTSLWPKRDTGSSDTDVCPLSEALYTVKGVWIGFC